MHGNPLYLNDKLGLLAARYSDDPDLEGLELRVIINSYGGYSMLLSTFRHTVQIPFSVYEFNPTRAAVAAITQGLTELKLLAGTYDISAMD